MKGSELKRWLQKAGCTFISHKGGSGHLTVYSPDRSRKSQIPMHGAGKELGTGLLNKILKDLGLWEQFRN